MKNASRPILAVSLGVEIENFARVVELPSEFSMEVNNLKSSFPIHTRALEKSSPEEGETHFAGGSALMLQMISTFSSLAAPTRTTLSVAQIGASTGDKPFVYFNFAK